MKSNERDDLFEGFSMVIEPYIQTEYLPDQTPETVPPWMYGVRDVLSERNAGISLARLMAENSPWRRAGVRVARALSAFYYIDGMHRVIVETGSIIRDGSQKLHPFIRQHSEIYRTMPLDRIYSGNIAHIPGAGRIALIDRFASPDAQDELDRLLVWQMIGNNILPLAADGVPLLQ